MRYTIENNRLRLVIESRGAQLLHIQSREVTLRSRKSGHGVRLTFPQMTYLGLWHRPKTQAPYLCIEPWTSIPARQDVVEDLGCKSDLIPLLPGECYVNCWEITVF